MPRQRQSAMLNVKAETFTTDLSHQLHERDKVNGGDSLPAAFLLLLAFFFWGLVERFDNVRHCIGMKLYRNLLLLIIDGKSSFWKEYFERCLTTVGCPGWSSQSWNRLIVSKLVHSGFNLTWTRSLHSDVDFMISTTESLTESLFFSSHPVTL